MSDRLNILLIGSGGREHALAYGLKKSPRLGKLYVAPGNAGLWQMAEKAEVSESDHAAVIAFCQSNAIDFVIVGPEAPLVDGLVDSLTAAGIEAFGPSREASQLEGSKGYTKDLCAEFDIPTAAYARFTNCDAALEYLSSHPAPIVIKADGLAAGKGVTVAMSDDEAIAAVKDCFDGAFGDAGAEVVIEAFLQGEEASLFALCDGETALHLASAQDHKPVGEGDTGPNTGGMGAYSPAPIMDDAMTERVMESIVRPTLKGMASRGAPFSGILFVGLMITQKGPELIEYNVRFGDPECQTLMMRLESDLLELLLSASRGTLKGVEAQWSDDVVMNVVLASKGYPGSYEKGTVIDDLSVAQAIDGVTIFHAGTAKKDGKLVATGGRVLNVCARGKNVSQAQRLAYEAVDAIRWDNGFCRRDIGWRAVAREQNAK
ncbi:phosphoribosylamine--glycine ligase [Cohaesibacter celericrescens]|uniref:Phosphoribosylamine--glycine ligase n=1 Tax=Cohaesibacter celericrescens TaxID=2067669 RepID=A0A2N5XL27_9HYPH|nr:phosphoribosylamine--glycine ligase [Cohaesibacter celericrescens]PLW75137.1 phosphoribosylamine--glycine ligase [Cohaesibacter celericrescens]